MTGIDVALRDSSRRVSLVLGITGLDKVLPVVGAAAASGPGMSDSTVPWPLVDYDSVGRTTDS
jgi:hypothetical protein